MDPAGRRRPVRVLLVDAAPMQRSGPRMAPTARRLLPDVLVVDLALPRADGLAVTGRWSPPRCRCGS
jgi:chemotaxis response regulator CheB